MLSGILIQLPELLQGRLNVAQTWLVQDSGAPSCPEILLQGARETVQGPQDTGPFSLGCLTACSPVELGLHSEGTPLG